MKKLSLKLGGHSPEKMSKDDMKKIKGGGDGDYGCPPDEQQPVPCGEGNQWTCVDSVNLCVFFKCADENPEIYDNTLMCY